MNNIESGTALVAQSSGISAIIDITKEATFNPIVTIDTTLLGDDTLPKQIPLHFDPANNNLHSITNHLDDYRDTPKHRQGTAIAKNISSFIALTNRHKNASDSVIFANSNMPSPHITTVIDYHTIDNKAQNLDHKIHYSFPITEQYKKWLNHNATPMSQATFALFLEQQIVELASPTSDEIQHLCAMFHKKSIAEPTELLELAKSLEITAESKIKNSFNPTTGERTIIFSEIHDEKKKVGKNANVKVPSLFIITVPAFVDGDPIRIPTRLSYTVNGPQINWTYEMYRPDDLLKTQIKQVIEHVQKETELTTFEGSPET